MTNYESASVSIYEVADTGLLTFVGSAPAGAGAGAIAIHPSGRFAYVMNEDDNTTSVFEIDPETGMLEPAAFGTLPTASNQFVIHPSGEFAYLLDSDSDSVALYSINVDTGALSHEEDFALDAEPSTLVPGASGDFLFVGLSDGRVLSLGIESTGRLELLSTFTGQGSISGMILAPSRNVLYVTRDSGDGRGISAHVIAASGELGAPAFLDSLPIHAVAMDPLGRFVFTSEGVQDQRIACYSVEDVATGALAFKGHTQFLTEETLKTVAIDPFGRCVHAVGANIDGDVDGSVTAFAISDDGELTELPPPVATGATPSRIVFARIGS